MANQINVPSLTCWSVYIDSSIMQICGVLLASPRSPRAEAAPLKGSLVSVRVRPGAHRTIEAGELLVCPDRPGWPAGVNVPVAASVLVPGPLMAGRCSASVHSIREFRTVVPG